jgi:hypothetical protein
MEFLDFEEVSFHPDGSFGHLCYNFNAIVIGIWYNTFQVQNTKIVVSE